MRDDRRCRECGAELSSVGPEGNVCPRCVPDLALETEGTDPGERTTTASDNGVVPDRIGVYRLLESLGEGGMGIVYLAEQREPVRRQVALKLIKRGMDSKQVLARFESERQALALMNHPGVARVFDAGVSEDGRPYFVMEHVRGVPITAHCDSRNYSLAQRLDLFVQVCEAIQHAHQKGIIHRDIKPSNVMVSVEDDRPVVKVIDFGMAKAVDQRLTEQTLFTRHGAMLGTPEYMSPEQAGTSDFEIDTRTDIYSLGVLLYELLVGALPFDSASLRNAAALEMQRVIREEDPPRPATKISSLGGEAEEIARLRHTDSRSLARKLKGELEWITMRTLEKNPERRYPSVSELAADLRRYLEGEPVLAGPPSTAYRLGKYVRKHRIVVAAAAAVLLALLIGVAGTSFGLVRALRAEASATAEADRANREAQTSARVVDFLVGLFEVSDPGEARGNSVTAREILDEGAERIEAELVEEPEVQARLMETMGRVYRSLGLYPSAQTLLKQSLEKRRQVLGPEHPDVATTVSVLAQVLEDQGDYAAAEALHREALQLRREYYGEHHPQVAISLNNLAALLKLKGDHDAAEPLYRESLAIDRSQEEPDPVSIATTMGNLALLLKDRGEYDEAEALFRETLELQREHLGKEHPYVAVAANNLGTLLAEKEDFAGAEELFRQALELQRKLLGEDHPEVGNTMSNLATMLKAQGDYEEAEPLFRQALAIKRASLGDDHPQVALTLAVLANFLVAKGDLEAAEPHYRESIAILEESLGSDHWMVSQVYSYHGTCLVRLRRFDEAERPLVRGFEGLDEALGEEHPRTRAAAGRVVELYEAWGKPAKAEEYRSAAAEKNSK